MASAAALAAQPANGHAKRVSPTRALAAGTAVAPAVGTQAGVTDVKEAAAFADNSSGRRAQGRSGSFAGPRRTQHAEHSGRGIVSLSRACSVPTHAGSSSAVQHSSGFQFGGSGLQHMLR